jgi:hypothetical protein
VQRGLNSSFELERPSTSHSRPPTPRSRPSTSHSRPRTPALEGATEAEGFQDSPRSAGEGVDRTWFDDSDSEKRRRATGSYDSKDWPLGTPSSDDSGSRAGRRVAPVIPTSGEWAPAQVPEWEKAAMRKEQADEQQYQRSHGSRRSPEERRRAEILRQEKPGSSHGGGHHARSNSRPTPLIRDLKEGRLLM